MRPTFGDRVHHELAILTSKLVDTETEVNISPKNQYFFTPPKMALHRNPGTPLSLDSNISARSPKKAIFLHIVTTVVIFLHGLPKKVFCAQLKRTSLNLQCITSFCFLYHDIRDHLSPLFPLTVLRVTVPDQYFCTKHPNLNITAR